MAVKEAGEQPVRGGADDYRIRLREPLQTRRNVGRVTQGQDLAFLAAADFADDD